MIAGIRAAVTSAKDRFGIPGLSVAVAAPAFGCWSEGFGLADVENGVPATADTVFRLASIAKPMTATAVMQLVERGSLDLDAPVQRYVPEFPEKESPITARLLLSHLSGIRDFSDAEGHNFIHYESDTPQVAFLDRFRNDPLLYEPGTRFRYSTHGYNLLGCVIESVSGTGYLGYLREHIFAPASMTAVYADDVRAVIPHRSRGYVRDEAGVLRNADYTDLSDHLPGGGFCATAEVVARFGAALQSGLLLNEESLGQVFTRQRTKTGQDTRFGLGWFLWSRDNEREAAHGGKHHGASTMRLLRPDSGKTVALLTNLQGVPSPMLHQVAREIGDLVAY